MLGVAQAQALVLENTVTPSSSSSDLPAQEIGTVLAEDVVSDIDMPPYDKALMDGYALRSADLPEGRGTLTVVEEIMAGQVPARSIAAGQAARIMTGAPIPAGADAVVMIERTQPADGEHVLIDDKAPKPGQNILRRGAEMRLGETVLRAGTALTPQVCGLLASVGRASVRVYPRPAVAVLPTGDEIVEVTQTPGPAQIRNSNGHMLVAQVRRAGGNARHLGIARDTEESLRSLIGKGLQSQVLLLSGGVSAGKLDLVPGVLQELGVQAHFHKVEMKPGKPLFFGTEGTTLVFGLPGNPVSSFVCFELFVRPAIRKLMGHADPGPRIEQAFLADNFPYRTDRPTYHPAAVETTGGRLTVRPLPWFGSPDLRGLARANALLLLPMGDHQHQAGSLLSVLRMEE
jgi:molybdopterin molybdotransferase